VKRRRKNKNYCLLEGWAGKKKQMAFFRRRLVINRCRTGWAVKSEVSLKQILIVLVLKDI
jgi:hypothetical protein